MIILVSGATKTVQRHPNLGVLVGPRAGNSIEVIAASGRRWAADNDAFLAWDEARFRRMVDRIRAVDRSRFLWLAAPDVVADAKATLDRWREWVPTLSGLPLAFVLQDGAETTGVPWDQASAVFIGGSTAWKLGEDAENLASEAKRRGLWVHMGRVNTRRRIRHAMEIGADSIDGRTFSAWPDRYIPKGLAWVAKTRSQPWMF